MHSVKKAKWFYVRKKVILKVFFTEPRHARHLTLNGCEDFVNVEACMGDLTHDPSCDVILASPHIPSHLPYIFLTFGPYSPLLLPSLPPPVPLLPYFLSSRSLSSFPLFALPPPYFSSLTFSSSSLPSPPHRSLPHPSLDQSRCPFTTPDNRHIVTHCCLLRGGSHSAPRHSSLFSLSKSHQDFEPTPDTVSKDGIPA